MAEVSRLQPQFPTIARQREAQPVKQGEVGGGVGRIGQGGGRAIAQFAQGQRLVGDQRGQPAARRGRGADRIEQAAHPFLQQRNLVRIALKVPATGRPADQPLRLTVLLDTSGSMDRTLLAKALGTIASYSIARDVTAVRVVFCDAATFDQGYMPAEEIAGSVKVRGRGGTILQPGIDLLEKAEDFPKTGPLLIITDGFCDRLSIKREHAFLLPAGRTLPFPPKGPVFNIR